MAGEHVISEAVRKLNRLEAEIKATRKHVQFLRTVGGNARELLRIASDLHVGAMAMEEYLLRIAGEAETMARRFPTRPFRTRSFKQQVAANPGHASAVGYRNELRALARRLPRLLDDLHADVRLLAEESNADINERGRWGDAAISSPVTDVFSFVFGLLELIAKAAQARRAARHRY